jgi:hypothetical protein
MTDNAGRGFGKENAPRTMQFLVAPASCRLSRGRLAHAAASYTGAGSPMTGVQFVTDSKGRKVAVLIDLKKHGARLRDFWDGLVSESRRVEAGIPLEKVKADLVRHGRLRE